MYQILESILGFVEWCIDFDNKYTTTQVELSSSFFCDNTVNMNYARHNFEKNDFICREGNVQRSW